ncbi:hypothetical protein BH10ACT7_BH10ACT7_25330 [soil metagenome]
MTVRALAYSSVALAALLVLAPAGAASAVPPDYTIITTIPVGASPQGIAVNYATNRIYVNNTSEDTVSVIDGTSNLVIATIAGFSSAVGIAVNSVTNRIYVASLGTSTLQVIDGTTNAIIATASVGPVAYGVAVDEVTNKIFVASGSNGLLYTVDGLSHAVITAPIGAGAYNVIADQSTGTVYVANTTDNTITVVDEGLNAVVATIPSTAPYTMAIDSAAQRLYVSAFYFYSEILVYDTLTNAPLLPSSAALPRVSGSTPRGTCFTRSPTAGPNSRSTTPPPRCSGRRDRPSAQASTRSPSTR